MLPLIVLGVTSNSRARALVQSSDLLIDEILLSIVLLNSARKYPVGFDMSIMFGIYKCGLTRRQRAPNKFSDPILILAARAIAVQFT